jgi:hypothetical protein
MSKELFLTMNDKTKLLVFEQMAPDCFYLREALASMKWGAVAMSLLGLALESTAGRTDPLAMAIFLIAFVGLIGGVVPL